MPKKVYVGNRVGSLEVGEPYKPVSRLTFRVDDDHYFTAGDDTGLALEYDMPWATQEMVDEGLKKIKGFVYRPFKATDVMIDPSAELGDGVTINGQYFMLAQMTTRFDAKGASDIGAPSTGEIEHEYPRLDPVERELKRRVKLGQKYQGVKIDRLDGLTITETDGDTDGAKAVLNSKELSFYDAGGGKVLFFDPAEGVYKFMGVLNVADKFIVDKLGNVKMAGGINLAGNLNFSGAGSITWGENAPTKKQFSVGASGPWHEEMQSGDKWRQDWNYDTEIWGTPYQFKGEDGKDGKPGSDATVPKYITETVISKGVIEAPVINANVFGVYPSNPDDTNGAFVLHAPVAGQTPEVFKIAYNGTGGGSPTIIITSGGCSHVFWDCDAILDIKSDVGFRGRVDFSAAESVSGIHATFA